MVDERNTEAAAEQGSEGESANPPSEPEAASAQDPETPIFLPIVNALREGASLDGPGSPTRRYSSSSTLETLVESADAPAPCPSALPEVAIASETPPEQKQSPSSEESANGAPGSVESALPPANRMRRNGTAENPGFTQHRRLSVSFGDVTVCGNPGHSRRRMSMPAAMSLPSLMRPPPPPPPYNPDVDNIDNIVLASATPPMGPQSPKKSRRMSLVKLMGAVPEWLANRRGSLPSMPSSRAASLQDLRLPPAMQNVPALDAEIWRRGLAHMLEDARRGYLANRPGENVIAGTRIAYFLKASESLENFGDIGGWTDDDDPMVSPRGRPHEPARPSLEARERRQRGLPPFGLLHEILITLRQ